jgi:hypothetical protein
MTKRTASPRSENEHRERTLQCDCSSWARRKQAKAPKPGRCAKRYRRHFPGQRASGHHLGLTAWTYLNAGEYFPDDVTNAMVRDGALHRRDRHAARRWPAHA